MQLPQAAIVVLLVHLVRNFPRKGVRSGSVGGKTEKGKVALAFLLGASGAAPLLTAASGFGAVCPRYRVCTRYRVLCDGQRLRPVQFDRRLNTRHPY